jgi:protein-S-isoprenylcysteine O-methyltransferase Ste14
MNIRKAASFLLAAVLVSIIFVGIPRLLVFLNNYFSLPIFTSPFLKIIGTVFIILGLGMVVYSTVQHLKTGRITPLPVIEQPKQFIASGLYKYCRNPMYLSWIFIYLGIFLVLGYFLLFLFTILVFLIFHLFVVNVEEPELYRVFGEQYVSYTKRVPRWILKISSQF